MKQATIIKLLLSCLIVLGYLACMMGILFGYLRYGGYSGGLEYFFILSLSFIFLILFLIVFRKRTEAFIYTTIFFAGIPLYIFSKAKKVDPSKSNMKVEQMMKQGQMYKDSLYRAIREQPKNHQAMVQLAQLYNHSYSYKDSVIYFYNQAIINGDQSSSTKKKLAKVYREYNMKNEALQIYQQILADSPNDSIILLSLNKLEKEIKEDHLKAKRIAYDSIVVNGDRLLIANQLEQAQAEYIKALKLDEHGKWARIGLTKIVIRRCKESNQQCNEIQVNLDYLKNMEYLTEGEIKALQVN